MFDLGTHRPFMYDALWSICSIGGLWAPLQNCFMVLDPCVDVAVESLTQEGIVGNNPAIVDLLSVMPNRPSTICGASTFV